MRFTATATATREVKTAQSWVKGSVKVGRYGLFVVLLGRSSTGSSFSANRKSFIVKKKLDGRGPTMAVIRENTKACG